MKMERFKNKAMWVSIFAFVALLGRTYGLYEIPENYDVLVSSFLTILTSIGILIDPTTPGIKDGIEE